MMNLKPREYLARVLACSEQLNRPIPNWVCTRSPAHALVAALALLSEGSPVAKNHLGTFIGHDKGMGHQVGVMPGSSPRQL